MGTTSWDQYQCVECASLCRRWVLCFASETLERAVLQLRLPSYIYVCVFMWDTLAPDSPYIFMCSLLSPSIWGKSISCPKKKTAVSRLRSSLFTVLACDGGATRSLPITDCHFDADATGGESNSLSPSLWNTVYSLEGHKTASEHRDTHFHAHMYMYTLT